MNKIFSNYKKQTGFSIVELIVVILVIGILAGITIVSYSSILKKVTETTIQSDLVKASSQIKKYQSDYGTYPFFLDNNNCPSSPTADTKYCLKLSEGNTLTYTGGSQDYILIVTNTSSNLSYKVTSNSTPVIASVGPSSKTFVRALAIDRINYGYSIVQTTDGGYALTGKTAYAANTPNSNKEDMYIAKYDSFGDLSWSKTWGGAGVGDYDAGVSIVQTTDGGYAVAGSTDNYGAGYGDAYIAKFDSFGSLSWSKTWGYSGDGESCTGMVQTSDGGYAITGHTTNGVGANNIFLAKLDSFGDLSWSKIWGGTHYDYGGSLVQTTDGGYVLTGETSSFSAGDNDMFLVKFDSFGNLSWSKTWGGTDYDSGSSLVQTSDNGYAVTGFTRSYGAGIEDVFIAKFDSSGSLLWSKTWGLAKNDLAESIIQTTDGGYAVTGVGNGYHTYVNSYTFLVKFNSSGDVSWSKKLNMNNNGSSGYSLVQAADGGYAVAGRTSGYGSVWSSAFIAKYNAFGYIDNCLSTMCSSLYGSVSSPSVPTTSVSGTITSELATITSPSATNTTPTPIITVVVKTSP